MSTLDQNRSITKNSIPSLDKLLRHEMLVQLIGLYGRKLVVEEVRAELDNQRALLLQEKIITITTEQLTQLIEARIGATLQMSLRPVFNLTGTVLHTNLGRAPLAEEAIKAMIDAARGSTNLEFDLSKGRRGDRDAHIEDWLCRLTGAEAAPVVNNNAAAVLLLLNSLILSRCDSPILLLLICQ